MKLTAYQIVVPLISIVAIMYAWNLVMRRKKTVWEGVFWVLFWGVIALFALYPGILHYLSALTGIADQVNAVFATSIGVLFFMIFYLVIRLEELEQRHAKLVRMIALSDADMLSDTDKKDASKKQDA